MNVYTHGDTITSLIWQSPTMNDPMLLVTSSSDGYIVFNKLSANFTNVNLHQRYLSLIQLFLSIFLSIINYIINK